MNVTISLVIPTYRRDSYLVETIRQALAQEKPAEEVLVVDQNPEHSPEVEAFLAGAATAGEIRHLRQEPPDLQRARNRGLLAARGDVVLYVDDDVVLPPGFVAAHRRNYADADLAGVAGRVVSPLTPTDAATRRVRRPGGARFDCLFFRLDSSRRVDGVANWIGANFSVRRDALHAVGGHDETYVGTGFNEVDTAVRLWKAGRRIVYDPEACLEHLMAPAGGQGLRPGKLALWRRSFGTQYFLWRHLFPHWRFWVHLARFSRRAVLHRGNLSRPWILPWATLSFLYALLRAAGSAPRLLPRAAEEPDGVG